MVAKEVSGVARVVVIIYLNPCLFKIFSAQIVSVFDKAEIIFC